MNYRRLFIKLDAWRFRSQSCAFEVVPNGVHAGQSHQTWKRVLVTAVTFDSGGWKLCSKMKKFGTARNVGRKKFSRSSQTIFCVENIWTFDKYENQFREKLFFPEPPIKIFLNNFIKFGFSLWTFFLILGFWFLIIFYEKTFSSTTSIHLHEFLKS